VLLFIPLLCWKESKRHERNWHHGIPRSYTTLKKHARYYMDIHANSEENRVFHFCMERTIRQATEPEGTRSSCLAFWFLSAVVPTGCNARESWIIWLLPRGRNKFIINWMSYVNHASVLTGVSLSRLSSTQWRPESSQPYAVSLYKDSVFVTSRSLAQLSQHIYWWQGLKRSQWEEPM
jgi:hypothetical protein